MALGALLVPCMNLSVPCMKPKAPAGRRELELCEGLPGLSGNHSDFVVGNHPSGEFLPHPDAHLMSWVLEVSAECGGIGDGTVDGIVVRARPVGDVPGAFPRGEIGYLVAQCLECSCSGDHPRILAVDVLVQLEQD